MGAEAEAEEGGALLFYHLGKCEYARAVSE